MTWTDVLAIDGPSGTGKSSVSRAVADRLAARYLDTGAMYRALTWAVLRDGVPIDQPDVIVQVTAGATVTVGTDPCHEDVRVDGVHIEDAIRGAEVTAAVSAVSAIPAVRERMVDLQRQLIGAGGIVVEGRDIGTIVAPDAALKIYLTAAPEARAARRAGQQQITAAAEFDAVAADLRRRDDYDSSRSAGPLRPAEDAVMVDTTTMTREQVVEHIVALARGVGVGVGAPRLTSQETQV